MEIAVTEEYQVSAEDKTYIDLQSPSSFQFIENPGEIIRAKSKDFALLYSTESRLGKCMSQSGSQFLCSRRIRSTIYD